MSSARTGSVRFWRILLAAVLVLGTMLSVAAPARAADAVVAGLCGEAEFNAALTAVQASGGGTITFSCGTAPFYIHFTDWKFITSTVAIDGGNLAILTGQNATRLFYVSPAASLTLKNLTVSNGNGTVGGAFYHGGAVWNDGALVVDHSKFLNNTTDLTFSGGAIATWGPLTVRNGSEFAYNLSGRGGAIFAISGVVVDISDSSFHHNEASGTLDAHGGALLAWDSTKVTVHNSDFSLNTANRYGGGLFILSNASLTMLDSAVSSNLSSNDGGGMYIQGSTSITGTLFSNNNTFTGGGGIWNSGMLSLFQVHP